MRCWGRTKNFNRCQNKATFGIVCPIHKKQFYRTLFFIFSALAALIGWVIVHEDSLRKIYTEYQEICFPKKFSKSPETYKVLLLPFHPLQNCTVRDLKIEEEVKRRLENLNEMDSLQIEVLIDARHLCPSTDAEAASIGKPLNADLVIWGDVEPKCFSDSFGACIRFLRIDTGQIIPNVGRNGGSNFQFLPSLVNIRNGQLMAQIDYIIYWIAAVRAMNGFNYTKAISYYEKIPNTTADVYDNMAACYWFLYHPDTAIFYYNKAYEVDSNDLDGIFYHSFLLLFNYSSVLNSNSNIDSLQLAKYLLEKDIRLCPIDANHAALLGYIYSNLAGLLKMPEFKDYKLSRTYYEKAIKIFPSYSMSYLALGDLERDIFKDYATAKFIYEKAITVNPMDLVALNSLAELLDQKYKQDTLARYYLERAIEIDSTFWVAQLNLSVLLKDAFHDTINSKKHYVIATDLNPGEINNKWDKYYGINRKNNHMNQSE